jgi:acetate kinase
VIITVNAGSSSVKFSLFRDLNIIADFHFKNYIQGEYTLDAEVYSKQIFSDHITIEQYDKPFDLVIHYLKENSIINSLQEIDALVHRIVHGGTKFGKPIELTEEVRQECNQFNDLAPLHNPFAFKIVDNIKHSFSELRHFLMFDTAFHVTIPKENFLYGMPYGYYENIGIRKYGFHGISHEYAVERVADYMGSVQDKIIICHLGSGSSVAAVKGGKSLATSFGFSPEENLIMSTRSGEVDYSAVRFVKEKLGLNDEEIGTMLNKESGLLGISGYTKDMKTLVEDYNKNERAKLAVDMYVGKICDYIAQFNILLQGCDSLIFTGGIGSGSDVIRDMVVAKLAVLGINHDQSKNDGQQNVEDLLDISHNDSKTKVYVVESREDLKMVKSVTSLL